MVFFDIVANIAIWQVAAGEVVKVSSLTKCWSVASFEDCYYGKNLPKMSGLVIILRQQRISAIIRKTYKA